MLWYFRDGYIDFAGMLAYEKYTQGQIPCLARTLTPSLTPSLTLSRSSPSSCVTRMGGGGSTSLRRENGAPKRLRRTLRTATRGRGRPQPRRTRMRSSCPRARVSRRRPRTRPAQPRTRSKGGMHGATSAARACTLSWRRLQPEVLRLQPEVPRLPSYAFQVRRELGGSKAYGGRW